jgi:hypothetical protein
MTFSNILLQISAFLRDSLSFILLTQAKKEVGGKSRNQAIYVISLW